MIRIVSTKKFLVVPIEKFHAVQKEDFPFFNDIRRLIERRPEYAQGIKEGVVHLAFLPGHAPKPKQPIPGSTLCGSTHTARMAGGGE